MIPVKTLPDELSELLLLEVCVPTRPTNAIPNTIKNKAKKWCAYYFFPRKIKAIPAVIITIDPLII
jgi:hypothetical protein